MRRALKVIDCLRMVDDDAKVVIYTVINGANRHIFFGFKKKVPIAIYDCKVSSYIHFNGILNIYLK